MSCLKCGLPAEIISPEGWCLSCFLPTLEPLPVLEEENLLALRQEAEIILQDLELKLPAGR